MTSVALAENPYPQRAADLLNERYGADPNAQGGEPLNRNVDSLWNPVLDCLVRHRSVRRYLPLALPQGALELIIAAAQSAASSSNLQTWSVVAVEDPARKARLAALAGNQKHINEAPLFLVWLADQNRNASVASALEGPKEALDYLEAYVVSALDAGLAAQNAVVALELLGLGCVYIGGIRNQPEAVAAELELPALAAPIFGLCVGYPDPGAPTDIKPRLPQGAVLHRETYASVQHGQLEAYDAVLAEFQDRQGMPPTGWTKTVASRVASARALSGRDRLREALNGLGFPLR